MHHRHSGGASSNGSGRGAARKQAAGSEEDAEEEGKLAAYAAPAAILTGLAILIGVGVTYKRELKDFIEQFVAVLDTWGPIRYTLFCYYCFPRAPILLQRSLLLQVGQSMQARLSR